MLVRFTNKQQGSDQNSATKTTKPDDLFVLENLTPTIRKIAYAVRQAKKKFSSIFWGTPIQNGVPYVWFNPTGRATRGINTRDKIVSHAMLHKLYTDTLGTPLDRVENDFSD